MVERTRRAREGRIERGGKGVGTEAASGFRRLPGNIIVSLVRNTHVNRTRHKNMHRFTLEPRVQLPMHLQLLVELISSRLEQKRKKNQAKPSGHGDAAS